MSCGAADPACRSCRLSEGRKRVVPGVGPCDARIMFVGEAPGRDEDLEGRPFVGRGGRLLNQALSEAGVAREQVRISNLVKCRPPRNRRPRKDEVQTCTSLHLDREIAEVGPRVICALGQTAAEFLAGRKVKMREVVGREIPHKMKRKETKLFVTYHPAACLYQKRNSKAFKDGLRASLVAAGLVKK